MTKTLNIHGYTPNAESFGSLAFYGTDAIEIRKLIDEDATLGTRLDAELPYVAAEVVWAAREEMARTVEDVPRPPHPRALPQLQGRHPHGPASRRPPRAGTRPRQKMAT